eukprot:CAMPEP_0184063714 /NCGR_PEP_ID=MMETSP0957-20130417/1339_1 /TAXON_ID=627963 /ORGANISM="Aplanochytrium sp, Strain PBS07" /LENGTH=124 /DNA_ID=CAMNT_0026360815 /DNA_START=806 /DNA_END=1180 /DNA_ORIENTATION=+
MAVNGDSIKSAYDDLLAKLKLFYENARSNTYINFAVAIAMLWPFLLRKASYQLPVAWGTGGVTAIVAVYLTCNNEQQAMNSRRERKKYTSKTSKDETGSKGSKIDRQESSPELTLNVISKTESI